MCYQSQNMTYIKLYISHIVSEAKITNNCFIVAFGPCCSFGAFFKNYQWLLCIWKNTFHTGRVSLKQFAKGIWSAVLVAYICRGCDNSAVERRTSGREFQFEPHDCWVVSLSKTFKLPKVPVNTKEAATPPKHDRKIVDTGVKN